MTITLLLNKIKQKKLVRDYVSIFNRLNLIKQTKITYCVKCRKKQKILTQIFLKQKMVE